MLRAIPSSSTNRSAAPMEVRAPSRDNGRMPAAVSVSDLRKSFAVGFRRTRRPVLRGLDLELETGTSLGLIGPNGSGKSTLLRVLAGVEAPTSGNVRVFDGSPDASKVRARIGFLPEETPFPAELSATEALQLLGALHGLPRAMRATRIAEALATVGLTDDASRAIGRFSKGMLRRFALAHTLLHEPDLVLLDEPTAGLDAPGHVALAELLARSRARGATHIIASHHLSDIVTHCERVIVLIDGRIRADGAPDDVLGRSGTVSLELEHLQDGALDAARSALEALGAHVRSVGPTHDTLVELYRRLR